ncbi:hypothetical protein [Pseudomonas sp. dw_612]|uniref:hypothetical protein n=1 Tax=Pseudomonas sp. dw_612 TaxID=2720080 RepID=UPI001BD2A0FD|nr:hypothetical protein [Pseudomonas sp. dw_612]
MPTLKNFVAVDWRAGKDKIYFFFKDHNTYSRFDIGDNRVPDGYPADVSFGDWHDFHIHAKNIRFGFTTTHFQEEDMLNYDQDFLWLFYYDDSRTPMVCKYYQDDDKVIGISRVADTIWKPLLDYFDDITAGTWWHSPAPRKLSFRFLMKDGNSLFLNWNLPHGPRSIDDWAHEILLQPITEETWPGLAPYKDRVITAAQNDRTLADSYYYIFLTNNEYITYNIQKNKVEYGPYQINETTWPGLLFEDDESGWEIDND